MSTEQASGHRRMAETEAPPVRPGLIVEDSGRPDHAARFRFTIPANSSAAFLTAEEAADLGRWLIWQAASRSV